jgi:hypothetical protein
MRVFVFVLVFVKLYLDNRNCEPFTWAVQKLHIASKSYQVTWMEGLKCYFFLIVLMRDKYSLHNININGNMVVS